MSKLNYDGLKTFKAKNDETYIGKDDVVNVNDLEEESDVYDDDIIIKGQAETGDLVRIKAKDFFAKVEDEIGDINSALTVEVKDLTLESTFALYDSNAVAKAYKYGHIVYIVGILTPTSTIAGSSTNITMFTVPKGFEPAEIVSEVCQGSSQYRWSLEISSSGDGRFARYSRGDSFADCASGAYLPFSAMYIIP